MYTCTYMGVGKCGEVGYMRHVMRLHREDFGLPDYGETWCEQMSWANVIHSRGKLACKRRKNRLEGERRDKELQQLRSGRSPFPLNFGFTTVALMPAQLNFAFTTAVLVPPAA